MQNKQISKIFVGHIQFDQLETVYGSHMAILQSTDPYSKIERTDST